MLKKLLVLGGILLLAGWAFGSSAGREAVSYLKTGWHEMTRSVKKAVPIDFEIKRAEQMLNNLDKADDRLISAMAAQIQAVRKMDNEIETMQTNLDRMKNELAYKNEELKTMLTSNAKSLEQQSKAILLEKAFRSYKIAETALKTKLDSRDRTQEQLNTIKEQRETLKVQRVELQNRIAALKTNLEYLALAQAKSKSATGSEQISALGDLKQLVDQLEERINTDLIETQLRQEQTPAAAPPAAGASTSVTIEIDSYFGKITTTKVEEK